MQSYLYSTIKFYLESRYLIICQVKVGTAIKEV